MSEIAKAIEAAFHAGYAQAYKDCATAEFGKDGPLFNDWSIRGSAAAFAEYQIGSGTPDAQEREEERTT